MAKEKLIDCKWYESCDCLSVKSKYCSLCTFYWTIDSGYGFCKALPEHILVPWCRDICSLFTMKEKQER